MEFTDKVRTRTTAPFVFIEDPTGKPVRAEDLREELASDHVLRLFVEGGERAIIISSNHEDVIPCQKAVLHFDGMQLWNYNGNVALRISGGMYLLLPSSIQTLKGSLRSFIDAVPHGKQFQLVL